MEAQEVVHYGWHDCLNGRRRAAEGENQILSVLETMPDTPPVESWKIRL